MCDTGLKEREKSVQVDFINIYKTYPALWDKKCQNYRNRTIRERGLLALRNKLVELEPNCTRDDVLRKINNLRSCFRREYNKYLISTESTSASADPYCPTLWYYHQMMFLKDQKRTSYGSNSTGGEAATSSSPAVAAATPSSPESDDEDESYDGVTNHVDKKRKKATKHDTFGQYVVEKMEHFNPRLAAIAQKLIGDVLFHGEMGTLTDRSTFTPTPPSYYFPGTFSSSSAAVSPSLQNSSVATDPRSFLDVAHSGFCDEEPTID